MLHLSPVPSVDEPIRPAAPEALAKLAGIRHALRLVDPFGGGPASDPSSDADLAATLTGASKSSTRRIDECTLRTAGDLMHGPDELPLVAPHTPMAEALLVMTEKRFGIVGVHDADGRLLGVITDGDLRRHIDGLLTHTAGEVMTPGPRKTAPPAMLASEALALMTDPAPGVTVLFVVEAGRPVGILHVHDLLRAGVM